MYQGKKILGIIPARGGSKRVARKNVRMLCGKPLIAYAFFSARESPLIDRLIVSTDDREIADIARQWGMEVPCMRPPELAEDRTPDGPVFRHALDFLEKEGERYEYVLNLRPTTPFRTADDIARIIETADQGNYDVVRSVTVVEAENHPYWMYQTVNGALQPLIPGKDIATYYQRQLLPRDFVQLNAVIELVSAKQVREASSMYLADPTGYIEIPKERSWDINEEIDLEIAELVMRRYLEKK
ncbi:MAG: N-acetylneuraminate cytidylyltransferase NeuA [Parcubacteria group bacterium Gr01-1014_33]|nr:MAG: N-acetylneuraminate cytidylyltransferase NeuA [Parcubacteria group bacterium Gr01-1014_33]